MIHDAANLPVPSRIATELCVVGSGPGGAMAAMAAAQAGLQTLVIEAGAHLAPGDMRQREEEMIPELLWLSGSRTTRDRAVRIHQGRGVGGSSLHNINLSKRIPHAILSRWHASRRLEHLPLSTWDALYDEVEALLSVSDIPEAMWSRHNRLLEAGTKALGWKGGGLRHNRTGCLGSGFCEVGCAYDAKNNAAKIVIPRAIAGGAEVLTHCQAVRVRHEKGRVTGVDAVALDPRTREPRGAIRVDAPRVCLAGSATGTPALLLRSKIPDPGGETGRTLRIHPGVVAAADFEEPVRAFEGVPQSYECTEFLELEEEGGHRVWIVPAFAHPMGFATLLPGHGDAHRALITRYAHTACFSAMLHDHTVGTVRPDGDLGLAIDYWPDEADRKELMFGLAKCAELLFAAGARRVLVPSRPLTVLERVEDARRLADRPLEKGAIELTAVHPMSSVPMGDDPSKAAVDSRGKHHHVEGLWVADGSLFPTSIGVPPQISIYALGLHVGRALARNG